MAHTPGPWRATRTHYNYAESSGYICIVRDVPAPTKKHPERMSEEVVHCQGHGYDEYCDLPNDADNDLIAAAPDLLAALEQVRDGYNDDDFTVDPAIVEKARAAIAKASGEVPATTA